MLADPIDQYLDLLKRRLPKDDPRAARLSQEAERDLRAAAERFAAGGWTREEAAAQAIAQYPSLDALARRFALDAAFSVSVSRPVKLAGTLTVVLVGLFAVASLVFAPGFPGRGLGGWIGGSILALAVLGHGLVTLQLIWSKQPDLRKQRGLVFLGGLALAVVGGFIAVWSLHLGSSTGDWEGYALLRGPLIALQGGLAAWVALPRIWSPWLE